MRALSPWRALSRRFGNSSRPVPSVLDGEHGGCPWERTLPACPGYITPCTRDACAARETQEDLFQAAKDFQHSSMERAGRSQKQARRSVFIYGFVFCSLLKEVQDQTSTSSGERANSRQRG